MPNEQLELFDTFPPVSETVLLTTLIVPVPHAAPETDELLRPLGRTIEKATPV